MSRAFGQRGHEGHGGGAAADDDHALARVVERIGPRLRMNDGASEALRALEVRREATIVAVVAAGAEEPAARDARARAGVGALDVGRPTGIRAAPRRAEHLAPEADVPVDAMFGCGLAQVREDLLGASNRLVAGPRLERVAEGVEVRVRADAGIAKEVPRAAARVARFEDGVRERRVLALQVVRGADAGKSGADDEHVDLFVGRRRVVVLRGRRGHGRIRALASISRWS